MPNGTGGRGLPRYIKQAVQEDPVATTPAAEDVSVVAENADGVTASSSDGSN